MITFEQACEIMLSQQKKKLLFVEEYEDHWVFSFETKYDASGGPIPGDLPYTVMKADGSVGVAHFDLYENPWENGVRLELPPKYKAIEESKPYLYAEHNRRMEQLWERIDCPCCKKTKVEPHDICEECGWLNDPILNCDPNYKGGANPMTLNDARAAYARGERIENMWGCIDCPCCKKTKVEPYDICSECGWKNDPHLNNAPDYKGGANPMTLKDARAAYARGEKIR